MPDGARLQSQGEPRNSVWSDTPLQRPPVAGHGIVFPSLDDQSRPRRGLTDCLNNWPGRLTTTTYPERGTGLSESGYSHRQLEELGTGSIRPTKAAVPGTGESDYRTERWVRESDYEEAWIPV